MYHDIRECDIFIADLTGARHNVMIEVGYALKHIDTGRMVFYFQETDSCKMSRLMLIIFPMTKSKILSKSKQNQSPHNEDSGTS